MPKLMLTLLSVGLLLPAVAGAVPGGKPQIHKLSTAQKVLFLRWWRKTSRPQTRINRKKRAIWIKPRKRLITPVRLRNRQVVIAPVNRYKMRVVPVRRMMTPSSLHTLRASLTGRAVRRKVVKIRNRFTVRPVRRTFRSHDSSTQLNKKPMWTPVLKKKIVEAPRAHAYQPHPASNLGMLQRQLEVVHMNDLAQ